MRAHRIQWVLVLSTWLGVATQARAEAPTSLPAETLRLANGLRVVLAPDPEARLVSVRVDYQVGSADDPSGLRGLAHLTEHLVASHTLHVPSVLQELTSLGAVDWNATTTLDTTSYFENVPPERLDRALWIESERMGFAAAALTEESVEREATAVRNETVQNRVNHLLGTLPDVTFGDLFPAGHPYADLRSVSQSDDLTMADVRAFLASWYLPSNAILAIAGRFDRASALASIEHDFGPLSAQLPVARPEPPSAAMPNRWLVLGATVTATSVGVAWRTPAAGTADDAALDLLGVILSSRDHLWDALREPGLATSYTARQSSYRQASVFEVSAAVTHGVNAGKALEAIERTVAEVAQGIPPAELERARKVVQRRLAGRLENTSNRAATLAGLETIGIEPGPSFDWGQSRYAAVDAAMLARVAQHWLVESPRVVTVIQPDPRAPPYGVVLRREAHP